MRKEEICPLRDAQPWAMGLSGHGRPRRRRSEREQRRPPASASARSAAEPDDAKRLRRSDDVIPAPPASGPRVPRLGFPFPPRISAPPVGSAPRQHEGDAAFKLRAPLPPPRHRGEEGRRPRGPRAAWALGGAAARGPGPRNPWGVFPVSRVLSPVGSSQGSSWLRTKQLPLPTVGRSASRFPPEPSPGPARVAVP